MKVGIAGRLCLVQEILIPNEKPARTNLYSVPRTDTGVPKVRSLRCREIPIVREFGKIEG